MPEQDKKRGGIRYALHQIDQAWGDAKVFFRDQLWEIDLASLPRKKKFGLTFLRVLGIVWKGITVDRCTLQASALTFFTLMSIVPVLAVMLSVSKGMGAQEKLTDIIGLQQDQQTGEYAVIPESRLAELPAQAAQGAKAILDAVERASFGAIGAIGLAVLFWTVVKVMGKIETTFNIIWGVPEPRTLLRKFSDYISVLVMVPVLVLLATSVNAMLSADRVISLMQGKLGPLYYVYETALSFSGPAMICIAFTCLYMFMPNTRVRLFPALFGGILGGGLWYLWQWFYFSMQVGLSQMNAIYGTFAAVPFFLFWVYLSWLIVLLGAEITFAVQNYRTYVQEQAARGASFASRELLGMVLMFEICRDYYRGEQHWAPHDFSMSNGVPVRLVTTVISDLSEAGVLVPAANREGYYVPGKDPSQLTLADVQHALMGDVSPSVTRVLSHEHKTLRHNFKEQLDRFNDALARTAFRDLVVEAEESDSAETSPQA